MVAVWTAFGVEAGWTAAGIGLLGWSWTLNEIDFVAGIPQMVIVRWSATGSLAGSLAEL